MDKEMEVVTPEYLLFNGFRIYQSEEEDRDLVEIPYYGEDTLHFREIEFDRNLFIVLLRTTDTDGLYDHTIYVQVDAGCGFVEIPERWGPLPIEYFESIYYGIRGERPAKTKSPL